MTRNPLAGGGVARQLDALSGMSLDELRAEWQRLYRVTAPCRLSHDLLVRGVAHRMQEQAQGGLRPAAKRRLAAWATKFGGVGAGNADSNGGGNGGSATSTTTHLKPGAALIRNWRGETHSVRVLDDGFDYRGERFASLTQIAIRITGAHWSGPRFFGLVRRAKQQEAA